MANDMVSESIIVVIDSSNIMSQKDFRPNRFEVVKEAILSYVKARKNNDLDLGGSTAFVLVDVNETAKTIFAFADNPGAEQIKSELDKIQLNGECALGDGVGKAVKILIEDIRGSGAREPRILIFSSGKYKPTKVDPMKMATMAQQLTIPIDTFMVGEVEPSNILKRIATTTGGSFNYHVKGKELIKAAESLGYSNQVKLGKSAHLTERITPVHKKIAKSLLSAGEMNKGNEDQKDLIGKLRGSKDFESCSICYMSEDPISKSAFNVSGRYCPNCSKPMHVSCASMWAKSNDKKGDGTVLRCPQCFYLIKIPAAVHKMVRMNKDLKQSAKSTQRSAPDVDTYMVSPLYAKFLGESVMYSACPVCSGIFEENDKVYRCGNRLCNKVYHLPCFDKLRDSRCKSCGSILQKTA